MSIKTRKKLIEVALPLDAINAEGSLRKRKAPAGYPTSIHKWWAQRPVASARAVIFAQMVDDPSSWPERFPTEEEQDAERQRLFRIIEELVLWENTNDRDVLEAARAEIRRSWQDMCDDNVEDPRARELFNPETLPVFHDPFCGGGTLPLEAQRLGLEVWASDLNPVAVLINKALVEFPPLFTGQSPIGPKLPVEREQMAVDNWPRAHGLAEDVRRYGAWLCAEAESRIGRFYPRVAITEQMKAERPDLQPYEGRDLRVIAWLWARTVKSPNPAFADVDVPLVSTFVLSTRKGKEAFVEPVIENGNYRFVVNVGRSHDKDSTMKGTKLARGANFRCLMSDVPIDGNYIKAEGRAGRMGQRLMAIVAEGDKERLYLSPTEDQAAVADTALPRWRPDTPIPPDPRALWTPPYGLTDFSDLFTDRQLVAATTFTDLVREARERAKHDGLAAGMPDDGRGLDAGGTGATAYADAICVYLSFAVSRMVDYGSSLATWRPKDSAMRSALSKQALPMTWDFAEGSPFGRSSSSFAECVKVVSRVIETACSGFGDAHVVQLDASHSRPVCPPAIVATDPPYYDNIGYADLSDFFYVWLRPSLQAIYPDIFSTLAAPKERELVATPYRHGGAKQAESFFLNGMGEAMSRLASGNHPAFPTTIYYAFKQSETDARDGTASTGWETFLSAVIEAGFEIRGTWPLRTEGDNRQASIGANALASSVVLVCRPRSKSAAIATRRDFLQALKAELPGAVRRLQHGNVAPVDLAQSAIGPGMGIYTRYARVMDADGSSLSVRDALSLINQSLDESLSEQEGEFDADTRWAVAWFDQYGFEEGPFGVAESLSKAKNTSVGGMVEAGILESGRGKVRLLRPNDLPDGWDPVRDERLTVWEAAHHLVRALDRGEQTAADLVSRLGGMADTARDLAYRLYVLCERKQRAQDALAYNGLVQSWPEIERLAAESAAALVQEKLEV